MACQGGSTGNPVGVDWVEVCCPTCGERIVVASPAAGEVPCRLDHDCEVCCRPMVLSFDEAGEPRALGIGE
jgi:hypothetical protein